MVFRSHSPMLGIQRSDQGLLILSLVKRTLFVFRKPRYARRTICMFKALDVCMAELLRKSGVEKVHTRSIWQACLILLYLKP
jgi:hypothetical protein